MTGIVSWRTLVTRNHIPLVRVVECPFLLSYSTPYIVVFARFRESAN